MKKYAALVLSVSLVFSCSALAMDHQMQHGFILSKNDTIANHLVANGHHSYQVTVSGRLDFVFTQDRQKYERMKEEGGNKYFLFQAQALQINQLPNKLEGHIVQMEIGKYEPSGPRIENAVFTIEEVLTSIPNPFFGFPVTLQKAIKTQNHDQCMEDCGRLCSERPLFCGQW